MNEPIRFRSHLRQPVWRWMILFCLITFLASFALIRALAPLSNSIIAHYNNGEQIYTGVVTHASSAVPAASSTKYVLYDGHAAYLLSARDVPEGLLFHKVRVRGKLHSNVLEVIAIDPA
jgi:hypothetical protein